ncbi:AroM family protein [Faecalicatena faecalis]|uniref:AroM family protein n=1 Tax=Faecalicatena faecalis TaxID=2726362 RepID=UPI001FE9E6A3|nr:AroM family protein [Faecalicatena faecalis]
MIKIGAVTIGQSPRVDVTPDILPIFGEKAELIQAGALDGLTREEITQMAPAKDDYVLVSRLNDGTFAKFGESFILKRMQECVKRLEEQGVSLIMVLCGGTFPDVFEAGVPIVYPAKILNGLAKALSKNSNIVVITPDEDQVQQAYDQWGPIMKKVTPIAANPYGKMEEVEKAAEKAKETDADLIVMDCIGYSRQAKQLVRSITDKPVLLCRTALARTVCELLDL